MKEIKNKEQYTDIVLKQTEHQFLQSWEWGEFQESVGRSPIRWMSNEQDQVAQAFVYRLPLGFSYIYWPRAVEAAGTDFIEKSIQYLKKLGDNKTLFIRLECVDEKKEIDNREVAVLQPADTVVLDLQKTEDEILAKMKSKTRYNIRLAQRKEVKVFFYENPTEDKLDDFYSLVKETEQRHDVSFHNREYYEKMLKSKSKIYSRYLVEAKQGNKTLATSILIHFGNTATYLHGASSHEQKNVMAPFLMQWEMIKQAKEKNCRYYDFFGIAPSGDDLKIGADKRKKSFEGITRFKMGFGGISRHYGKGFEIPIQNLQYKLWKVVRSVYK